MRGRGYALKRVIFAAATTYVVLTLNFLLFRVLPGNAVTRISHVPHASPQLRHSLEVEFGLDRPLTVQYWLYLKQLAHGNLGISYVNQAPVSDNLRTALSNTIPMVATGTVIALLLGIFFGVLSAVRRGTIVDQASTNLAVLFYAFPTQFLGLMLLILGAGHLPTAGMSDPFALNESGMTHLLDVGRHMVLPVLTLVLTLYAENTLIVRSAMLETLGEDYILTARAKGVPRRRIIRSYALRNALLPTVTLVALSLGSVVSGAILVEVIFSWPGIGEALYQAVLARDYPMLQGGFLVITLTVIALNLVSDLLYAKLDPRITT
jgi:ABC-type dipeptide/oligopeptide/nickel transport system permease component